LDFCDLTILFKTPDTNPEKLPTRSIVDANVPSPKKNAYNIPINAFLDIMPISNNNIVRGKQGITPITNPNTKILPLPKNPSKNLQLQDFWFRDNTIIQPKKTLIMPAIELNSIFVSA